MTDSPNDISASPVSASKNFIGNFVGKDFSTTKGPNENLAMEKEQDILFRRLERLHDAGSKLMGVADGQKSIATRDDGTLHAGILIGLICSFPLSAISNSDQIFPKFKFNRLRDSFTFAAECLHDPAIKSAALDFAKAAEATFWMARAARINYPDNKGGAAVTSALAEAGAALDLNPEEISLLQARFLEKNPHYTEVISELRKQWSDSQGVEGLISKHLAGLAVKRASGSSCTPVQP